MRSIVTKGLFFSFMSCIHGFAPRGYGNRMSFRFGTQTVERHNDKVTVRSSLQLAAMEDSDDAGQASLPSDITNELEYLDYQLSLIEALEERNTAQLDSFMDEQDQWDSMEANEKELLQSKESLLKRREELVSELVNRWMGQKSMEG